jgi:hypothetical protein
MQLKGALFNLSLVCLLSSALLYAETGADAQTLEEELFIVHFYLGPAWDATLEAQQQNQFSEHSANLQRLRKIGMIKFGARYDDLGLIVVKAKDQATAEQEIANDPGVKAEIFRFRIAPLSVFYAWE